MPAATPEATAVAVAAPTRLRAFGLALESRFPVPGAVHVEHGDDDCVLLESATRAELLAAWDPAAPERISDRRMANGRAAVTIDADERAGYLIRALGFGTFWISPDARRVRCAPLRVPAWRWQRYLIGQVLPLAAVLHGHEVFHASAVVVDGGAAAFIGMSTAGKTSVALNLVLRGARFLTDDVLAVTDGGDRLWAHPGVAVASLRHDAAARLDADERRRLGRRVGRDPDSTRIAVDGHPEPVPLRHVFILERTRGGSLAIEPLRPVDPRLLLGGSFNFIIRTPERLINQLDVCARIANGVPVSRAAIPPSAGPADVAAAVARHLAEAA